MSAKIEMGKEYRTRRGYPVRIYCTDGGGQSPVHGSVDRPGAEQQWDTITWDKEGKHCTGASGSYDLIEVKPRIRRTVWLNVYDSDRDPIGHRSREKADASQSSVQTRIACVRVDIDVEHVHGLDGDDTTADANRGDG